MGFIKISITTLLGMCLVSTCFAQDESQNSDKIKQILLNTRLSELDMSVEQSAEQSNRDTSSVQYKIGFKDGYQKAVADLKNSLSQDLIVPTASATVAATNKPEQTDKDKATTLASKSFEELVHDGNWDAAISSATAAIKLNPNDSIAYINRSWGYAEKGNLDAAISDADKAVELSPRNPMAHNNRAYAYELAGSLTKAKQDYKIACELNYQPACETVAKFDRAMKGETDKEVKELLNRSYQKFKQKDWKAVEEISTHAINIDPGNAMAYVNRSGARAELGLLSTALDDCNRAIQLNPKLGLAHNNCGYTYELMGQAKQAEVAYQQACDLGVKTSCRDYFRIFNAAR